MDVDVINKSYAEDDDESDKALCNYHITETAQQMLLFRHCYFCGNFVDENTIKTVFFFNF